MLIVSAFFVTRNVGDCGWTIYARAVLIDFGFRKFSNSPPNSASMDDAMTFLSIMYSTCTGTFSGGIVCIVVLDFGHRKNIDLICFVPLVLRCRIYPNICGESSCFFYILLLSLDVPRCNLKIELSALWF